MTVVLIQAKPMADLQFHGNANECMPIKLERDEFAFAGKLLA